MYLDSIAAKHLESLPVNPELVILFGHTMDNTSEYFRWVAQNVKSMDIPIRRLDRLERPMHISLIQDETGRLGRAVPNLK